MVNPIGIFCDHCGELIDIGNEAEVRVGGKSLCLNCWIAMKMKEEGENQNGRENM